MKKLLYGAAYYDEYMPYDRLQQDVAMMKKAGINTVRIAESTWSTCEPQEGVFDFSHVERVMDAMEEAGIGFDPARNLLDLGAEGFAETQARAAIVAAFEAGRLEGVTAFFCSTDMVAFGVMQGLQSLGFAVPDDFSVIGLDDVAVAANSRPPLTTMRIDRPELGRAGVSLLLQRINDPSRAISRVNIGVELVERATVGPPRGQPAK